MKICLVGSILRHTIESDKGSYSGWGGMTESAVAPFAALLGNDYTIYFVGSVGEEDIDEVRTFFKKNYPLVDVSGIHINPTGTDHHHGTKHFVKRKVQVEPTKYEHIKPYVHDADVVIFNFGNMYTRGWPNWEKYLKYADMVQMDKNECEALFGSKVISIRDAAICAKKILDNGTSRVFLTLGNRGVLAAERGLPHQYMHAPAMACRVIDTTGCGDAFAAGYLVSWHEGKSLADAVKMASLMGSINC